MTALTDETDGALVRRFVSGQQPERAFTELFRRYGTLTHAFFRRRIGDVEVAAEQNQELYLRVLEHLGGFRGDCSFRAWLFSLAHNQLFQLRRRLRTHTDEEGAEAVTEALMSELQSPNERQPEAAAVRAEHRRLLRRCMARLSELERAVVFGQYYRQVTLRELTETLRLDNPSGARASLIKAQRRLRHCMEASGVQGLKSAAGAGGAS